MGLLRKSNLDIPTGFSHIWAPFQLGIRQNPISVHIKLASLAQASKRPTRATSRLRVSIKALKAHCFLSLNTHRSPFRASLVTRRPDVEQRAVKRSTPPLKPGCFPQDVAQAESPDGQKDFHR